MAPTTNFQAIVVVFAVIPQLASSQPPANQSDSGLTFSISTAAMERQGSRLVLRAILDNKTDRDWYMRTATLTVSLACEKGLRSSAVSARFSNPELAHSFAAQIGYGPNINNSIKPGRNEIVESFKSNDATCKFDSLSIRFKNLKPVDDTIQKSVNADRDLQRAVTSLKAAQPKLDEMRRAADAEESRRCHALYATTADKKVGDLTVKETQEVKACQQINRYN